MPGALRPGYEAASTGVSSRVEFAAWSSRAAAIWIDFWLVAASVWAVALIAAELGNSGPGAVFTWGFLAAFPAYSAVFVGHGGETVGKRVARVRVVSSDGTPVRLRDSVLREFVRLVLWLPPLFMVDYLWPLRQRSKQTLHDMAANTVVVAAEPEAPPRRVAGPVLAAPLLWLAVSVATRIIYEVT